MINGDLNANPVNMHPQFIGDYPQPKVTTSKIPDLPPSIQAATESPGLNRPPRSPGPVLGPFVQFISTDLEKMLWMGIVLIFLHVSFDQPHIEFICDVKVGYKWKTLYENIFDMRAYCINLFVELGSGEGDDEIAWKIDWGDNQTNDSFLIARCESYSFRKKRLAVSGAPEGCRRVSSR